MPLRPTVLQTALWRERIHPSAVGNNLPIPPTPLIGREQEHAQATALLHRPDVHLLTLYGTGGVGKTRLALSVAADLASTFPDGIFFIPLENITDSGLLLSAISQALELYTLPDELILPTLISYMKDMGALLILDNFEQLTTAAPILAQLLSVCPRLKLLVTSRNILKLRGEHQLEVLPFPTLSPSKDQENSPEPDAVENSPAVQLFVQRARSVKPNFALTKDNVQAIADICARLDGLPLALELASARIKFLSPKALLAKLQKRLQVLTDGAQDLPARQQTLHNAITWSYELLTPTEQRIFRLISVFSGGCTMEAAESVCTDSALPQSDLQSREFPQPDTFDVISSLANKSLVRLIENEEDDTRLVMLETLREYALEQLRANNEEALAQAAHAHYFRQLTAEAGPHLRGSGQALWLSKLERELGNLRAALEWCTSESGHQANTPERLDTALRIAGELSRFWEGRSYLHEGDNYSWIESLLARTSHMRTESREIALRAAGRTATNFDKFENATAHYEEAVEIARERGDRSAVMRGLLGIGNVFWAKGNWASALKTYEDCLHISTELDNKPGTAGALNNIGVIQMYLGDPSSVTYLEQSAQMSRALGDTTRTGSTLNTLGRANLRVRNIAAAEQYISEGFAIKLALNDHLEIAYGLMSMAEVACERKDYRGTARLLAAANATFDDFTGRLDHFDQRTYALYLDKTRDSLGKEAFETAWAEGMSLTPEAAMSLQSNTAEITQIPVSTTPSPDSPGTTPTRTASPADISLTTREIEVLTALAKGLSNIEVAKRLTLSPYTVQAHLRSIFSKLNVASRVAAARYAIDNGLI